MHFVCCHSFYVFGHWLIRFRLKQRLFENIERRSETYGISNALTTPLRERNSVVNATSVPMAVTNYVSGRRLTEQKYQLPVAHTTTTQTTSLNMDSKENVDMAFEINVPSGTDVQVNC